MNAYKNSVLIVDDEFLSLSSLSNALSHDYTIYVENNGRGCIDSAQELKPDLILLNTKMPDMTGIDVIKVLKSNEETCNIPVVFVTELNSSSAEEECFIFGAADYIIKPFSIPVVCLRIKNQMQMVNNIRNKQDLTVTDILTGISSKRHFNAVLNQEWRKAIRYNAAIGLMIIDVDNFEVYNAKHGHLRGDIVLKKTAQLLSSHVNGTDYHAARWGGEEFAIVMPHTDINGMMDFAILIRNEINNHDFIMDDVSSSISVSIGINAYKPSITEIQLLETFISDTTNALSRAYNMADDKIAIATHGLGAGGSNKFV